MHILYDKKEHLVLPLKIMVKTVFSFTLYSHHQYMLFHFIYLLAKLSSWFTQFYGANFNKVVCLIRLNHFPTMLLKRYQTHGSQFSFFFFLFFSREERFHIKPVICHSLKALSSQLTIQTLFIIAEPLKRTHPVLTH